MIRRLALILSLLGLPALALAQSLGPQQLINAADSTCAAQNTCAVFQVGNAASLTFGITGTFTGTLTFQSTVDGTTWVTLQVTNAASGTTPVTTATSTGQFSLSNTGFQAVRVAGTSWTSGNALINATRGYSARGGGATSSGGLATPVTVPNGGTGLATLTANNVLLGNGTSTPGFVAPGSSGNVLTSNGTTWASSAAASSGECAFTIGAQTMSSAPAMCTLVEQTSGSSITVTLPAASGATATNYKIGLKNDTTNIITVARTGTDTIDGGTSFSTYGVQYESFDFVVNAAKTGWMIR